MTRVGQPYAVCVFGSRDYAAPEDVRAAVRALPKYATVIVGGARGVDTVAEQEARRCNLRVEVYPADWSAGRSAGMARNSQMVARADYGIAFWDGRSRGTADTIKKFSAAGKNCEVTVNSVRADVVWGDHVE